MLHSPALLASSHGTRSVVGQQAISALTAAVASAHPQIEVRQAYVDIQAPDVPTALADLAGRPVRIVPLLLSTGFHVQHDLVGAAAEVGADVAATLGPDPALVDIIADRVRATAGPLQPADEVILAAAGSSDPQAIAGCEAMAGDLSIRLGRRITVAYLSAVEPRLAEAVAMSRAKGAARVVVAGYLLAPGHFANLLATCGADVVTGPLLGSQAPDPRLVDLVWRRYLAG